MTPYCNAAGRVAMGRVLAVAAALVLGGLSGAFAQFPPPPGQTSQPSAASPFPPPPPPGQGSPFPPPPGQSAASPPPPGRASTSASPFPPPTGGAGPFSAPGQRQGSHPCEGFIPLRQDAEKGAAAIKAAGDRKASREEVCPLFQRFAAAEAKMVKFVETNQQACGIPADAVKQIKVNHGKTTEMRNRICSAGAAPRAPSLSDAFGGGPAPTDAPKPGRGTFDTLTGPIRR